MRRTTLLITLFLLFGVLGFGQMTGDMERDVKKADELLAQAHTISDEDTSNTKLNLLKDAAELYQAHPFSEQLIEIKAEIVKTTLDKDAQEGVNLALETLTLAQENGMEITHPYLYQVHLALTFNHSNPMIYGKSAEIILQTVEKPSELYFNANMKFLELLSVTNQVNKWKPILEEMEEVLNSSSEPEKWEVKWIELYSLKADYYSYINDYEKAIVYGIKTIEKAKENNLLLKYIGTYSIISISYARLNDKKNAKKWVEESIKLLEENKTLLPDLNVGVHYNGISFAYFAMDELEQALTYIKKKIGILLKYGDQYKVDINIGYGNIALIYSQLKKFEEAKKYYELCIENGGSDHMLELRYSDLLNYLEEYEKALEHSHKALTILIPTFSSNNTHDNPAIWEFINTNPYDAAILETKSDALLGLALKNKSTDMQETLDLLNQSILAKELAIEAENIQYAKLLGSENSQLYQASASIEKPFDVQHEIYQITKKEEDLDKTFLYIEKNKAKLLLETLSTDALASNLVTQKNKLIDNINYLEQKLLSSTKDSITYYRDKLFQAHNNLEKFIQKIKETDPSQAILFNRPKYASVQAVQEELDDNTLFISYAQTKNAKNKLYTFTISNTTKNIVVTEITEEFEDKIHQLKRLLQDPFISQKVNRERFIDLSYELYQILIKPIEKDLEGKSRLTIGTERSLFSIPFETLLASSEKKNFEALEYLVKKFDINYHYSGTTYKELKNKPAINNKSLLAFAPIFNKGQVVDELNRSYSFLIDSMYRSITKDRFSPLPHTQKEVETIAKQFQDKGEVTVLLRKKATKNNLMKTLEEKPYQFVHLATHGLVNFQNHRLSALACFEKEGQSKADALYFANEIQMQKIQADLVVLSSCESGIGQFIKGEGLIALNRSFIRSGARNVLFSLWKVSDQESSTLMIDFYKEYLKNPSYTAALRQAKLNMINNPKTALPTYWAPFVLIGE